MSNEKKNDGGPAFPTTERVEWHEDLGQGKPGYREYMATGGMTLRDYFAAKAMRVMMPGALRDGNQHVHREDFGQLAGLCYEMADAMIKASEE